MIRNSEPIGRTRDVATRWRAIPLSGESEADLEKAIDLLEASLAVSTTSDLSEHVSAHARKPEAGVRRCLVARDTESALATLRDRDRSRLLDPARGTSGERVAFLFPGLGDHYPEMAADLYNSETVFRQTVDRCSISFEKELGLDLRTFLYPSAFGETPVEPAEPGARAKGGGEFLRMLGRGEPTGAPDATQLCRTEIAQPATFTVEYALAQLFMAAGVRPEAMIGYSVGEYVASTIANVVSLDDAIKLVAHRSKLIARLPTGAMLAVPLPQKELEPLLGDSLSLAAVNGESACVAAGEQDAIDALQELLAEREVICRPVSTQHAFHSHMMEPILEELTDAANSVVRNPPSTPYVSSVTGDWITDEQAMNPSYWGRHLAGTVRFADSVRRLIADPQMLLLEVGPGQTLTGLAAQIAKPQRSVRGLAIPSLRHIHDVQHDSLMFARALGRLWLSGIPVDWEAYAEAPSVEGQEPASLPTTRPSSKSGAGSRAGVESQLTEIWKELLELEEVEPHENFTELGGTSLVAGRVLLRIRRAFGVNLTLRALFQSPTISQLGPLVSRAIEKLDGQDNVDTGPTLVEETPHLLRCTLPNGMEISQQAPAETRHFYQDIFEHETYLSHGIELARGDCVFDVGANIGLFSLFIHSLDLDIELFSFEPVPALFRILSSNLRRHGVHARPFNFGLSDRAAWSDFTFYANSSGMSSFRPDLAEERSVLEAIVRNQAAAGDLEAAEALSSREEFLAQRMVSESIRCRLRTLSDVIAQVHIDRIDLLKVDVQKCEREVLDGLTPEDWPKIRQIALEVHDIDGRVGQICELLEAQRFTVVSEQDALYRGTNIYMVYARREFQPRPKFVEESQ